MSTTEEICSKDTTEDVSFDLPEPPEKPLDSDCCGTGCTPCVFDIYDEEMLRWRIECDRIRRGETLDKDIQTEDCSQVLSTSEFRSFTLDSITRVTGDSCVYRFNIPGNRKLGLKIGQHLIMRGKFEGKTITRQYTPISDLDCRGHFDVLIKVYMNGKMSWYVKTWQVGNMIEWRGPYGNFSYTPNQYRRIGMLAAGTGIAPMMQVIQGILSNEQDETFIHLVYSNRTYNDILMKQTLDEMKAYWNFSVLYVESEANQSKVKYGDHVSYGRITQELVSREMPEPSRDVRVLICGTKSFDKDMINYLKAIGYTSDMYFKF
ncbi:NADH-cytochrome b5 reductase-like isoform X2 [Oculina patagonica]